MTESPNIQDIVSQTVMEDTKQALASFEKRFRVFSQQQFIFVTALDRCRRLNFEPSRQISTIAQVQYYHDEVADNATDKRIFSIFLALVYDLAEFRRALEKIIVKDNNERVKQVFHKWKKILHPRQDISGLRCHYPDDQINHLSCDEARNHFGGIVSLIPVTMNCVREMAKRMESSTYSIDDGSEKYCLMGKFKPKYRPESGSLPRSRSATTKNVENDDEHLRRIPTPLPRRPRSAVVSGRSTPSTRTVSETSVRPASVQPASARREFRCRPVSVTGNCSYVTQAAQTSDSLREVQRPQAPVPGKGTQTPKFFGTPKPNLKWAQRTVSEHEMRKFILSRQKDFCKPNWKP